MKWADFIRQLEREVDWTRHSDDDVRTIEALLYEASQDRRFLTDAVSCLVSDQPLYQSYLQHMEYPRPFMDKFVLHMHEQFRVRLHRFRPGRIAGLGHVAPTIHDHRWPYTTCVLRGTYNETIYEVDQTGHPIARSSQYLNMGHVKSLSAGILHQTYNENATEACITLFVRGDTVLASSRVWDPASDQFRTLPGRGESIREQLDAITAFVSGSSNCAGTKAGDYS